MANEQQQPCAAVSYESDFARALEYCQSRQEQQQRLYVLKRVPPALLQTKEEAYKPHFVSLGPLHYSHMQLQHIHRVRQLKFKLAADLGKDKLNALQNKLSEPSVASIIKSFYCFDDASGLVQNVAVDALFLLRFLRYLRFFSNSSNTGNEADKELQNFRFLEVGLKCDVVMLENQLPLQVLALVYQVDRQTPILNHDPPSVLVKDLTNNALPQLSPFVYHRALLDSLAFSDMNSVQLGTRGLASFDNANKESHHLLDMLYSAIAPVVTIAQVVTVDTTADASTAAQCSCYMDEAVAAVLRLIGVKHPVERDEDKYNASALKRDFEDKYNASALKRAGIKFRSPWRGTDHKGIWFDRSTSTLMLPRIFVTHNYTEVLLRNLMALEFNDDHAAAAVGGGTPVTKYVQLMNCLIDSAEDVAVLRKAQVLRRDSMMLQDEQVAKMWDDLSRHSGRVEPSTVLKNMLNEALIRNYYKSFMRGWWKEFRDTYLSRPWTVVALLAATILLFAELVQTYCAFGSACTPTVANQKQP